jgi:hypothetical protein
MTRGVIIKETLSHEGDGIELLVYEDDSGTKRGCFEYLGPYRLLLHMNLVPRRELESPRPYGH